MLPIAVARSSDGNACNTLCTSGFADDVMFSHHGANGPESKTTRCFVHFVRWRHRGRRLRLVSSL